MVKVTYQSRDNKYRLSIDGHAGYKPAGEDIVCAGVSAIAYSLMGYLELNKDKTSFLDIRHDNGRVYTCCCGTDTIGAAFQMAITGLEMIAASYPQNVSVTILSATGGDTSEQTMRKGQ